MAEEIPVIRFSISKKKNHGNKNSILIQTKRRGISIQFFSSLSARSPAHNPFIIFLELFLSGASSQIMVWPDSPRSTHDRTCTTVWCGVCGRRTEKMDLNSSKQDRAQVRCPGRNKFKQTTFINAFAHTAKRLAIEPLARPVITPRPRSTHT